MRTIVLIGATILLLACPAYAEDADLDQTLADLGSQTGDKEKMDSWGSCKVEINQMRGWLTEATNAIKERETKRARRWFELVRAQMPLVDQLMSLAHIEAEAARLEREVAQTRQQVTRLRNQLDDRRVQLRALKLREGEPTGEGLR